MRASSVILVLSLVLVGLLVVNAVDVDRKHHRHHHRDRNRGADPKLSARLTLTQAQIDGIKTLLSANKWAFPGDQIFWHWTTFENCIRLVRILNACQTN